MGMKKIVFFLVFCLFLVQHVQAQNNRLPEDIEEYYRDRNFMNTFSFKSEREILFTLLSKGEDPAELQDDRMLQIANIMKGLVEKILPVTDNMSTIGMLPIQLTLPEINHVYEWKKHNDRIQVIMDTYSLDHDTNVKMVASYTPDQIPQKYDPIDLSSLKFRCQEVHEWYYHDNGWYKSTMNKILLE